MFNSVLTKKVTNIQKIKNMFSESGRLTNLFAKELQSEGYGNMHQRKFGDNVVIQGLDALGKTKTYLLSPDNYKVKTNFTQKIGEARTKQEIDKAEFNPFGSEISGKTKTIIRKNNSVVNSNEEERGWYVYTKENKKL